MRRQYTNKFKIQNICFFQPDKCTTSNLCGVGEGDCDSDEECTAGLKCGSNNCFTDEGPGSEIFISS